MCPNCCRMIRESLRHWSEMISKELTKIPEIYNKLAQQNSDQRQP